MSFIVVHGVKARHIRLATVRLYGTVRFGTARSATRILYGTEYVLGRRGMPCFHVVPCHSVPCRVSMPRHFYLTTVRQYVRRGTVRQGLRNGAANGRVRAMALCGWFLIANLLNCDRVNDSRIRAFHRQVFHQYRAQARLVLESTSVPDTRHRNRRFRIRFSEGVVEGTFSIVGFCERDEHGLSGFLMVLYG